VYKYIPNYYPDDVGAVGGLVGAIGALGGFVLPPIFGAIGRRTGAPQSAFIALLAVTALSLAWLHLAVLKLRAGVRPSADVHLAPSPSSSPA
jgi:NNP family nitrate/nitrite transporter-like MFS transporter